MNFKVNDVEMFVSRRSVNVDRILREYQTNCQEISDTLKSWTFSRTSNRGFQVELHKQLVDLFALFFRGKGLSICDVQYSSSIDLRADLVIGNPINGRRIYIEIEFRPNEFKDIVKFQIGYKHELELGILVCAKNRDNINRGYTTMPEYKKCKNIIIALEPESPILLIGFDGEWY